MALLIILYMVYGMSMTNASTSNGEMALANVTRFATGDLFTLVGTDCGPTRCMEVSHGTALAAMGDGVGCVCQCQTDTPAFREDQKICVNHIDECVMASFGRGAKQLQIPFVFLPLKGQIIYPSKEIIFTDVENAICAVTSAQYLSASGWVTLRDLVDNDVPFGLYRDEGSTFLQWRGSAALHARLEGRLVAAHVLCSAPVPTRLATSCAAFRVAGASHNALLDVRSIPFHAGETVTTEPATQSQGLSVLESLAIGVCVLMLIFIYAAGIVFYVHYKKRQKRKEKDPEMNLSNTLSTENGSSLDSRIDMESMRLKTNPLLKMDGLGNFLHDTGLSDVSEHTEDTIDSSPNNTQKLQKANTSVISAIVHTRRKKPARPSTRATTTPERLTERLQRRSASPDTLEKAPHSDLSIIDCSVENNMSVVQPPPPPVGESVIRRKLYFNPLFFEIEHLKNPPPAAIDFLLKIREVMSIAKEKMTLKRFIPILSDIPEEELYHTIDLGWDIPCARRGRRFSAISLKRENSRRAIHCGGCPGCDSSVREQKNAALARSNSCKSCVSEDYKQKIIRKWLDEVPSPPVHPTKPIKSVAKVSGTPRVIEPKIRDEIHLNPIEPVRSEDTKTLKVTDSILREDLHDSHGRENFLKREIKRKSETKLSNKGLKRNEDSVSNEIISTQNTVIINHEIKSPSSHTTRRVRKKLPPPPPPPVPPPEPPQLEDAVPIPPEVKKKMEAVIRELNECRRVEQNIEENYSPISPKIVIPVLAADSNYYSDDNLLSDMRKKEMYFHRENLMDFDSLERNVLRRRRFSLACGPELIQREEIIYQPDIQMARERLSRSWRDVRRAVAEYQEIPLQVDSIDSEFGNRSLPVSEIFINSIEPVYNNIPKPGPLTIEVRGSPVEGRRNVTEDFDPDTLDRKPKREAKKRVDKILLKSGGSFKNKSTTESEECNKPAEVFTRKIGSLRQIYEAKTKTQIDDTQISLFERRGSVPYEREDLTTFVKSIESPDFVRNEEQREHKPSKLPKQKQGSDTSPKSYNSNRESPHSERRRSSEERDRFPSYSRGDNLNARRSGRRSAKARSRRTDFRKLHRTEDSGYLSTDSNESKRRARYLMQLRPRTVLSEPILTPAGVSLTASRGPPMQIESDTDLESLCDGRSESGGESVETDSVFFGNFDDSKQMFAELRKNSFDGKKPPHGQEQIDSGFAGETNIILSGDSDSEHKSVISIVAGLDGRASAASVAKLDEAPYINSVDC